MPEDAGVSVTWIVVVPCHTMLRPSFLSTEVLIFNSLKTKSVKIVSSAHTLIRMCPVSVARLLLLEEE